MKKEVKDIPDIGLTVGFLESISEGKGSVAYNIMIRLVKRELKASTVPEVNGQ